ncbi:alkaline phosphatase family protein [bacterium]|nr:alkaline phosphatase family protein [bacterium]MCI0604247.1 alkaline phosphatase family protein [bacterium]
MSGKNVPLVILAIDAGDVRLIQHWVREGHLPTFSRFMQKGSWGTTVGSDLMIEHGIWVSILSGLSRDQTGYYDFRQLKPGTYQLELKTSKDAKANPFWFHLRGRDKKVAIIDAQEMYPILGLNGIQISNWSTHEPAFGPAAEPQGILSEVRKIFGPQIKTEINWYSTLDQDVVMYRKLIERVKRKGVLLRHLLKQDSFDLVVASFGESHTGGHQFWKYVPESGKASSVPDAEMMNSLRAIYQSIDQEIEELLAQFPSDTTVFLITSAGMENYYPTSGLVESFCRVLAYQPYPVPTSPSLHPMSILRRILPESLRIAISRHLPRETREQLVGQQFTTGTDWARTTAFAPPSFYSGWLRVNLKGREPMGVVTREKYDDLMEELQRELSKLIDPKTGLSPIDTVPSSLQLFGVSTPEILPDLFVKWKPHADLLKTVRHPKGELNQNPEPIRDSGHSDFGFIAAMGPNIRSAGNIGEVQILDLAPTFLTLMKEPIPPEMKGRPAEQLLAGL